MKQLLFTDMIDSYLEDNQLTPKTVTNYRAVRHKLELYQKATGANLNVLDYDILAVKDPLERREKIKGFTALWNNFTGFLKDEYGLSVQTRNTYRLIFHAVVKYSENQFGIAMKMPPVEKAVKYSDRKRELSEAVVNHLFGLYPGHHWAVNVVKLALYTCWRVSDLVQIKADDIVKGEFLGEPCYFVARVTKKTGKPMKTPVPIKLINSILRTNNVQPGDYLIKFPNGNKRITERILTEQVRSLLNSNQFLREQKIVVLNVDGQAIEQPLWTVHRPLHLLRAAGASYLIAHGMTPDAVAKWFTGHESSQVLKDHYITSDDFTGAKQLFRDRFASTFLKQGDYVQGIFDQYEEG